MKTLADVQRLLGCALLVACKSPEPKRPPPPDLVKTAPDAAPVATRALDAAAKQCRHDKPDITGCGGAEVKLHDSYADCGLPAEGDIPDARCAELCAGFESNHCRSYSRDGEPSVFCEAAHPCMGRLASDGRLDRACYADGVVDYLALARRMEAHSVTAFAELEADLARWGAPDELRAACRHAADDETAHADAIAALLVARGIALEPIGGGPARGFASLEALALHNEREGVVGELWGALVARYQADHAADDDLRAAMHRIAQDEAAHAALSLRISAWARTRVDPAPLDAARRTAFAALHTAYRPDLADADRLGWPPPLATAAMLETLAPALA